MLQIFTSNNQSYPLKKEKKKKSFLPQSKPFITVGPPTQEFDHHRQRRWARISSSSRAQRHLTRLPLSPLLPFYISPSSLSAVPLCHSPSKALKCFLRLRFLLSFYHIFSWYNASPEEAQPPRCRPRLAKATVWFPWRRPLVVALWATFKSTRRIISMALISLTWGSSSSK